MTILVSSISFSEAHINQLQPASTNTNPSNALSDHWVPNWGFRGELSTGSFDYRNFWTDDAGKILVASALTRDYINAGRALEYLGNFTGHSGYYLPELLVNSTLSPITNNGQTESISNRIVRLQATNSSSNHYLEQLAVGTSYTSATSLAYIGGDRLWIHFNSTCCAYLVSSSQVYAIPNGFSKVSKYYVNGSTYYVYVNATLHAGQPYVNTSVQIMSPSATVNSQDYIYLQAYSTVLDQDTFARTTLYNPDGSFNQIVPDGKVVQTAGSGILIGYSNASNIYTSEDSGGNYHGQDAIAIRFGNQSLYDLEHYAPDNGIYGLNWIGVAYHAPASLAKGAASNPVYSQVYPILDFDYRLVNDTTRFITLNRANSSVSPPVGFGFISLGLALLAENNTQYMSLAKGYWNYYYARYNSTTDYSTIYGRSINVLALAGFMLYGQDNHTIQNFARQFIRNTPGASIEEYAWAIAALYQLAKGTNSTGDWSLYNSFVNSFTTSPSNYVVLQKTGASIASWTFQYGETVSGLLLGGVPFNNSIVLAAMSAVYQSNLGGTFLNQPLPKASLANTETLPAYVASAYLFENAMKSATGYSITSLNNANLTSMEYSNGSVLLNINGNNGTLVLSTGSRSDSFFDLTGLQSMRIGGNVTTIINTVTSAITTLNTVTETVTQPTATTTIFATPPTPDWLYGLEFLVVGVILGISSLGAFMIWRKRGW